MSEDATTAAPFGALDKLSADAPSASEDHPVDHDFPQVDIVDATGNVIGDVRTIDYTSKAGTVTKRVQFRKSGGGAQMIDAYAVGQYARALADLG